jgi:hypothetical protein
VATTPRRRPNSELRSREHLTVAEVERLMKAAKKNRWGHRDTTMILVAYRHGLRVSELVELRWDQIEFATATLSAESSRAPQVPIPSQETSRAPCGGFSANRIPSHPSCSRPSGAARSPLRALPVWWNARGSRLNSRSRRIPTCCGTPAATPWPTRGTTRELCKPTSGTRISNIRSVTRTWRPRGLKISGVIEGEAAADVVVVEGRGYQATLAGILPNWRQSPLTTPATLILCNACKRRPVTQLI